MAARRYQLLCPIARTLDHLGDRWTLLVLRDLHAGPARFSDLEPGLPGIATNLLTDRLRRLEDDGLVRRRDADFGAHVYELTDAGRRTAPLLFELARLGALFPPDADARPANLRRVAVALQESLRRVVPDDLVAAIGLTVGDEALDIAIDTGDVTVRYGQPDEAGLVVSTTLEAFLDLGYGDLGFDGFFADHLEVVSGDPDLLPGFTVLLRDALALISGASAP
ncbi:MAG: helix-turn-helix transcriptional regulator [Actinobacteria bacterium]|nr:helix-turn-helix transcriptional regulator [Actinomycetota bacterium]